MDYREYLTNQTELQLITVARLMWPKNKNANVYLSMKLNGTRPWTTKDDERAKEAIQQIAEKLTALGK